MPRKDFERLVVEGFGRLPQWVQEKIKNAALLVEDEPSEEDRKQQGLSQEETLLGLYKGIPLSERGDMYGVGLTMPDTITLYQRPIEEAAHEECPRYDLGHREYREVVAKIVAETIWHEFAHHFGMDEGEVRGREQQRRI